MARSWYRLTVQSLVLLCPLTPERAAALQGAGYKIEPATRPADGSERVAAVVVALMRPTRPLIGV